MNTQKESKIKYLLDQHSQGTVLLPSWMESIGISRDLQKVYRKYGWLETIGTGAFKRFNEKITWEGGLYAIQKEAELPIHPGGLTALSFQGLGHYVRMSEEMVYLFSQQKVILPRWFLNYKWGAKVNYVQTSLLPENVGLTDFDLKTYSITISAPERAILECLYLAPKEFDLMECYHLMEGLSNLRPKLVTELLEKCSSVKVKRLFLFMAEKAQHQWFNYLDIKKIDLGTGDRSLAKGGTYNSKYGINIPKELV
ncbi:MAG: hypothetical protein DI538_22205 [Azospira oryzae]|jgi:hypothetical protein|nr:hypothetical protein [Cytophaga sp.]PZR30690.1 MAG: hypothetical protein DI538_22205 [Azospira oryzae]